MDARRDRLHARQSDGAALLGRRTLQPGELQGDAGHAPRRKGPDQAPAARRALHHGVHAGTSLIHAVLSSALAAALVLAAAGAADAQLFLGSRPNPELTVGPLFLRATVSPQRPDL